MMELIVAHRRELIAGIITIAIVWGLVFGGMYVAPMGPIAMVIGFGMLVAGSAIAVVLPLVW